MLECKNLTVAYGKSAPVLRDVSFTAHPGRITAILGENGCGKSTLLRAIMQEIPHTGVVLCDNSLLAQMPPRQRALCLSLLPQHLPAPALSLGETVALGLSPRCAKLGEPEWQAVDSALQRVGLLALRDRPVSTLSGGERQRAFLALLLLQDTNVLLLDEPTAHMDLSFTAEFYDILREERARGKTILLVMHDVGDALALSDDVVILQGGAVAFAGSAAQALERHLPETLFHLCRYTATGGEEEAIFFRANKKHR